MVSYPLPGLYRIQYKTFLYTTLVWPRTRNLVHIGFGLRSTPHDPVATCDTNTCTLNPLKCWLFSWFHPKTDRETDREVLGSGFVFFRFCLKKRPKPTDIWWKTEKPTEPFFIFGSHNTLQHQWTNQLRQRDRYTYSSIKTARTVW